MGGSNRYGGMYTLKEVCGSLHEVSEVHELFTED